MAWQNSNSRQLLTWAYLYTERELATSFSKSENIKLNTLPYWQHAGGGLSRITAKPIAIGLHDLIASENGAKYEEPDMTYFAAIAKLIDALTEEKSTVKSLANTVDDLFHLPEEEE